MAKKRKKKKAKPKIEQVKTEPELSEEIASDKIFSEKKDGKISVLLPKSEQSETPIIEDEQATAPIPETDESKPDLPSPKSGAIPPMSEWPIVKRPVVEKEPEPVEVVVPVICAGCKSTVESDTTRACLHCSGSLVFCLTCAKPGTCHKCGKGLK